MLDIGRGYGGWMGWGRGHGPERRQEHVPYLYSLLTWQRSVLTA